MSRIEQTVKFFKCDNCGEAERPSDIDGDELPEEWVEIDKMAVGLTENGHYCDGCKYDVASDIVTNKYLIEGGL